MVLNMEVGDSTSPYLYAVEHFYTNKGTLPKIAASKNEYPAESKWLDPAGVTGSSELFNICVAREPRFYAWLGFHQGDYSSRLSQWTTDSNRYERS